MTLQGASSPVHVGDRLPVTGLADGESATVKLTNAFNGQTRSSAVAGTTPTILFDASTLPGFRADTKVQEFQVDVATSTGSQTGNSIFVVTDADAQAFPVDRVFYQLGGPTASTTGPMATPGPGAWASADSTNGPEAFIQQLLTKWNLKASDSTHVPVERKDVVLPSYLKTTPDSTKFVRYEIKGQFPKYLVPKEFSSTGQTDVYTPTSLSILLTQTDPADLVSLMAK